MEGKGYSGQITKYRSIKIVLGYRNSTPINVMTAESQILRIEDRTVSWSRNFWTKTVMYGGKDVEALMNKLDIVINRNSQRSIDIFLSSWREIKVVRKERRKHRFTLKIIRVIQVR